jgi:hypothetical protein
MFGNTGVFDFAQDEVLLRNSFNTFLGNFCTECQIEELYASDADGTA